MTYEEYIDELKKTPLEIPRFGKTRLERHHILPACMGGSDDENNLIWLKPEEHYIAHKMLAEEHMDCSGLLFAWASMLAHGCDTPEKYAERVQKRNKKVTDPEVIARRNEVRKNSKIKQGRLCKPVYQYDLDGNFVAEYASAKEAAEYMNCAPITIQNCALGNDRSAKGFLWRYVKV